MTRVDISQEVLSWFRDTATATAILSLEDTPYQGGVFKLEILIPGQYQLEPPQMRFLTPLYLHNVDEGGRISQDILKPVPHGSWKRSINISSILTLLQVLLSGSSTPGSLIISLWSLNITAVENVTDIAQLFQTDNCNL